jgi:2-C-methyl-D-erythritol 2,4-cyclodiphosphate synthase
MFKSGIGYDIHRFKRGRKLILGGVEIPNADGLEGHSDADVLLHALSDALLGAIAERDIGHHFPNTDESIRGISSLEILRRVKELLAQRHATVINIDATLIAEAPKIGPHLEPMRENIAAALGISKASVGIKATTNEGLGALGRGEGIAALAVASIEQSEGPKTA